MLFRSSGTIIGRLGASPETRHAQSGSTITTANVACDTGKGQTTWVRVSAFGKQGEFLAQNFGKGDPIAISGDLKLATFEKDGVTRTNLEMTASTIRFVPKSREQQAPSQPPAGTNYHTGTDGDLPF